MFGDMDGMMAKLQEAQQKIAEARASLNNIIVSGESGSGKVKVTATANREIRSISIDDSLFEDKEALEDFLIIAINNTLESAHEINEKTLSEAAQNGMPNIPGFDL
ncbi:MAG TPA: YbaB/EbfC family nucleoid-associated protein [Flavobacteriaceae bacterium]|nr:YbaB/EbfC family nucleoid-associated protein [Flavobacteriaceae bacterium]